MLWIYFSMLSSATQHAILQNPAESREQSILTLGSLCLPCCVRDLFIYIMLWHNTKIN